MAKADTKSTPKIALNTARDIPFNKIILSQKNVRRVKRGVSIDQLAEDIAHRGLIQSLNVRAQIGPDGEETGMFEAPAGGRRYRALELLVKQKRLSKTAPVPTIVRAANASTTEEEDSLAENVHREDLHPLDQFNAFSMFIEQGLTHQEIAARFFVPVSVVKQRLRLASVSPKLHDAYADDQMTLDQLMAFSITDDHARQEQVWESILRSWNKEPRYIRSALMETTVHASDKRARFVGYDAYVEAGGIVSRDLFEDDKGGWFEDVGLLERLVAEKLKLEADLVAVEGWKWVEAAVSFPFGYDAGLRELELSKIPLGDEDQAVLTALQEENDRLVDEYDTAEELPEEVERRFGEIESAIATLEAQMAAFNPDEVERAGAFVSIDDEGTLCVDRGYIRQEDEVPQADASFDAGQAEADTATADPDAEAPPVAPASPRVIVAHVGSAKGTDTGREEAEDGTIKPLPDRLVMELTAHRTLAVRDAVANNPRVAMTLLLHKLCTDFFHRYMPTGCLEAEVRHVNLPEQAPGLKDSSSAKAIKERHDAWKTDVPKDDNAMWDWLVALDDDSRAALLAHCLSFGVNVLFEKVDRHGGPGISASGLQNRLAQADRLALAVGLDMVDVGWTATVDNYLGRVPKVRILEAVNEARGEHAAQLIDHLKRADMAKEAERLLDGSGWLPEPLRTPGLDTDGPAPETPNDAAELPAFLADEGGADAQHDAMAVSLPLAAE